MASTKKVVANRKNAKKSTGPRTASGKLRASRNALRHGLASMALAERHAEQVKQIANALCENDPFPYRFDVAIEVAEAQVMINQIRLARARMMAGLGVQRSADFAEATAVSEVDSKASRSAAAGGRAAAIGEGQSHELSDAAPEKRRTETMSTAISEIARLERYEMKALSRKTRAARKFDALQD